MYQDNMYEGNYEIVAIVKKTIEGVKSLADLKGKNACFPEYGGLGNHVPAAFTTVRESESKIC